MNLFPPVSKTPCQRVQEHAPSDGTKKVTLKGHGVTVTVTYNCPTPDALDKFAHTLHDLLLHIAGEEGEPSDVKSPRPSP